MLDFSRPAAFAGGGAQQQQQKNAPAAPSARRANDSDDDGGNGGAPPRVVSAPAAGTTFRAAPVAAAPRQASGQYANFLQSANILGLATPTAVPPPPPANSSFSSSAAAPSNNGAQQEQVSKAAAAQQKENVRGGAPSSAFSSDARSSAQQQQQQQPLTGEDRTKMSREALQRQLESFGISEALDPASAAAAAASGAGAVADPLKGLTHFERILYLPRTLMHCTLTRKKGGIFDGNVYFALEAEHGSHFFVTGRKRTRATTNFLISTDWSDMHRDSDTFIAKVRGNESKTVYAVYDNGESIDTVNEWLKTHPANAVEMRRNPTTGLMEPVALQPPTLRKELAYIVYETNFGGASGPRKMIVIVPKCDATTGRPLREFQPTRPEDTMFEAWKQQPHLFWTLETKAGTWNEALRTYQLNFKGRVKCQSVKNFQLVEPSQPNRVVLQVGKRGEDDFICDFQAPLNSLLAFAVASTAFDGNIVRE